jgi:hypothetical protein
LALFKFKADILDKLGISIDSTNYNYVEKLSSKFRMIVLDQTQQIRGLLAHGIMFDEVKSNSASQVGSKAAKYVKNKQADLIFGHINIVPESTGSAGKYSRKVNPRPGSSIHEVIDCNLKELNSCIEQMVASAEEDTCT